jgi:hypothetical protein
MDTKYLIDVFEMEGRLLDSTLRQHPRLRRFFTQDFARADLEQLKEAYLRLLKMKADYVCYTVPALRAAGEALENGDAEDRAWSGVFLGYAGGETDQDGGYGHHVWALDDMKALGASEELLRAPPASAAIVYGRYFVEQATRHPYAILGAKGALEHFSLRVSDDLVAGLLKSGIRGAEKATSFFKEHGVLDIEHVREGDKNIERVEGASKRIQVLEGAHATSGLYRMLVQQTFPL